MIDRKSYFIRSSGPNLEAAKKALEWIVQKKKVFLAVLGYSILGGMISDIFGENFIRNLKKYGRASLNDIEVTLVTQRKILYDGKNCSLITFYPNLKFLDELDSIPNISEMLVVPWSFEEVEPWIRTWNAIELDNPPHTRKAPLISNPVVRQALKSLTACINVSTGIAHPLDRDRAIQTFEILRDGEEVFNPADVKAYLIAECGWKATDAQEVAELVQKVLDRKKLRKMERPAWKKNILEIWRKKAAEITEA